MLNKSQNSNFNLLLANKGEKEIKEAMEKMPVLDTIAARFSYELPFKNLNIILCSHLTKETAVGSIALKEGGANVVVYAANRFTSQESVGAALVKKYGIPVYGNKDETEEEFINERKKIKDFKPDLVLDDSAEALPFIYNNFPEVAANLIGSSEQTTGGINKIRLMEQKGMLKHPVIAVSSSKIKRLFDNVYGVSQSIINTLINTAGIFIPGKTVVIIGYGDVGRGLALRFKGMGASIIVVEITPLLAMEAYLNGYQVMNLDEASTLGDIFITATGSLSVIPIENILKMKAGAYLCNAGSGRFEVDVEGIEKHTIKKEIINDNLVCYTLDNKSWVNLFCEGRVANLVASGGNSSEIMDFTFSAISLAAEYLVKNHNKLENKIYIMPEEIDNKIAFIKLNEYGVKIAKKNEVQKEYDSNWHKKE